jgi:hypothetical protein
LVDEIIRQMLENACEMPATLAENGSFSLEGTPRFGPYSLGNQGKVLRREPNVCCKNIKSESGT